MLAVIESTHQPRVAPTYRVPQDRYDEAKRHAVLGDWGAFWAHLERHALSGG